MSGPVPRIALAERLRARPLTQAEAGFVLGLARRDIRNMLRRGELRARWSGRRRLVDPDATPPSHAEAVPAP